VTRARIAVLASGGGSNLQAIIDHLAALGEARRGDVVLVASNRPDAGALARAERAGIPHVVLRSPHAPDGQALGAALAAHRVQLVALAGYMRHVPPEVTVAYRGHMLNVHPALLPAFKGLHAQRQALEYGARITGATVHLVDQDMDHGPIVLQGAVPIAPDDTEATLAARILTVEHAIFPAALQLCVEGRVRVVGRRVIVDGVLPPLPPPMLWLS
jgi:phosphoribosylglycinamide formyltransferase-1